MPPDSSRFYVPQNRSAKRSVRRAVAGLSGRPPVLRARFGLPTLALFAGVAIFAAQPHALAANRTFIGGSATFSLGFDATPANGDTLLFGAAGAGGTTVVDDITALTVGGTNADGIDFTASASPYTINATGGAALTLASSGTVIGINDLSSSAETISVPLTVASTQTINVGSRAGSLTLSGVISGTGFGLNKTGSGILTLSGANSFTGAVTVTGGTLAIASDSTGTTNPLGSGAAGAASLTLDGGTLRTTASTQISINRGILLGDANAGTGGTIDVNAGTLTYNGVMANNGGTNSLTVTGGAVTSGLSSSTLALGGVNTYTGNTNINFGTLKLDFTALPGTTTNILNSGSTVVMGGPVTALGQLGQVTVLPTLNVTGKADGSSTQTIDGLTLNPASNIVSTTQTNSTNVLLNLGAITHNAGGLVNFIPAGTSSASNGIVTSTANSTVGNAVGGASTGILGGWAAFKGTSYATNNGTNIVAYTGYTAQAAGAVTSSPASNLQVNATAATALTVPTAMTTDIDTLSLATTSTAATTLTIGATGILRLGAQGGIMIPSGASGGATLTITGGTLTAGGADSTPGEISILNFGVGVSSSTQVSISSVIADNGVGNPVKLSIGSYSDASSTSVVGLNGANTYTGGTWINSGRVTLMNAAGFGAGSVTVAAGAQVFLNGVNSANNFIIAGGGTNQADTPVALRLGTTTVSGTVTLQGDAAIGGGTGTISGQITGGYNLTVGRTASSGAPTGTVTISNTANNYTGNTILSEGTVKLGNSNVIPDGANAGNLVFSGAIGNPTFDLNGNSETINGLSGLLTTGNTGIVTSSGSGAAMLTLGNNDQTATFSGTITDGGAGKTLAITKMGAGTQTFQGANTYNGATTVNAGTLLYNGNLTPSVSAAVLTVGATATPGTSATLGGTGILSLASAMVNSNGTLAPGTAAGATTGALTLNTTSGLTLSGTLTIGVTSGGVGTSLSTNNLLTLSGATLTINGTLDGTDDYLIAKYGTELGTFSNFTAPNGYTINYAGTSFGAHDIELDPTAVPEPSAWLGTLMAIGAGAFIKFRRKVQGA